MTDSAIAIVGSRHYPDLAAVRRLVDSLPDGTTVVSGGAAGVDTTAVDAAKARGLPFRIYPADWNTHGNRAGYLRNVEIVDDVKRNGGRVVAFHGNDPKTGQPSSGTSITISVAEKAGIPVEVIRPGEREARVPQSIADQIHTLAQEVARYRGATGARQQALRQVVDRLIGEAEAKIDRIMAWLEETDFWLKVNPIAPNFTEIEDQWLDGLKGYEALFDATGEAKTVVRAHDP